MYVDSTDVCINKINGLESLSEVSRFLKLQKFGRQLKWIRLNPNVLVSDPSTLHRKTQNYLENVISEVIPSYIAHTVPFPIGNHKKTYCR
jgi:hypothetical protein